MEQNDLEKMTKEDLIKLLLSNQKRLDDSDEDRKALRDEISEIKALIKEKKKEEPKGFLEKLFSVEVE